MKSTEDLKKQVENLNEAKDLINNEGLELTDNELDNAAGGELAWRRSVSAMKQADTTYR